jgi:segregation and condensation protein A
MTHTVAVGEFEGPLGILLDLVERGRLEVTVISVAEITEGYLKRIKGMEHLSPEELSEFIQLGARLLYIKSLALLPQESAAEQDDEIRQLNLELEEYRRMQLAARALERRGGARTWQRPAIERLSPRELPLPNLELSVLTDAFSRALRHMEPARETAIIRTHISLESVMRKVRARLSDGSFDLQQLIDSCRNRLEVIVTFLALLELVRDGGARVVQAGQFDPITVEATIA